MWPWILVEFYIYTLSFYRVYIFKFLHCLRSILINTSFSWQQSEANSSSQEGLRLHLVATAFPRTLGLGIDLSYRTSFPMVSPITSHSLGFLSPLGWGPETIDYEGCISRGPINRRWRRARSGKMRHLVWCLLFQALFSWLHLQWLFFSESIQWRHLKTPLD